MNASWEPQAVQSHRSVKDKLGLRETEERKVNVPSEYLLKLPASSHTAQLFSWKMPAGSGLETSHNQRHPGSQLTKQSPSTLWGSLAPLSQQFFSAHYALSIVISEPIKILSNFNLN